MLTRGQSAFLPIGQDAPRFPHVEGQATFDVIIVGAGITGLTTARLLGQAGLRVAVIEARRLGSGTTGWSTGHLTQLVDSGYHNVEKDFGEQAARDVAASLRQAIQFVEDVVVHDRLPCQFRRVPAYLFAEDQAEKGAVKGEYEAAVRAGLAASLIEAAPLPFPTTSALRVEDQASFDSSAYVQGLAARLPPSVTVFEGSPVLSIEEGQPFEVRCPQGTLRAGHVIDATHVPLGRNTFDAKTAPYRSYVLAARTSSPVPVGIFWDTKDPYNYIRTLGDMVIVGGADHKTGQTGDGLAHYRQMRSYIEARFADAQIVAEWTAEYYVPVDGLPYIGPTSHGARHLVATGFDGDGLVFGTLAGLMLADAVQEKKNPYADLYSPSRFKPVASAGLFVKEQANVALHLVSDRFGAADAESVDAVPRDAGRLVDIRGHRCAVYRDESGQVHIRSATCPHAGGIVQWNAASHTWDCPLHGGCFSPSGVVLGGPPAQGLGEPPAT
jgi:glycine/D-amino acid oxidase-like deaminating enzyme/nitrite reductase/ring-hydroxylating ferredoxin subunit